MRHRPIHRRTMIATAAAAVAPAMVTAAAAAVTVLRHRRQVVYHQAPFSETKHLPLTTQATKQHYTTIFSM